MSLPERQAANTFGTVALVLAILLALLQVGQAALSMIVPTLAYQSGLRVDDIAGPLAAFGVIVVLLALATTVFGIIGMLQKNAARIPAAIALGAGAISTIGGVASLVIPPLIGFALSV